MILDLLEEYIRKTILAEYIHQANKVQVIVMMKVLMNNLDKILILQIMWQLDGIDLQNFFLFQKIFHMERKLTFGQLDASLES